MVIGDRKPFIASIISLDLAETNLWLESRAERVENLEEATKNPIVRLRWNVPSIKPTNWYLVPNSSESSRL